MTAEKRKEYEMSRDKVIIKASIVGILTNIMLVIFKAIVGFLSNSIAIILDAVNNLSDVISSVVTIVGTKLAGKRPDKEHPFGHGRIEYLSAMVVAGIILYAGITSAVESVKKILNPVDPNYSVTSLIIIAVAVVVKIILGTYVKNQGKKVNSGSLIASGSDALFDAIISFSVLVSAIIFILTKISLEPYVGIIISLFILKSGLEIMVDTLNEILGVRADKEITQKIKEVINEEPEVNGVYDLVIYNYGPDKNFASLHIELPEKMAVKDVDKLTRRIEDKVFKETGIILVGVGVYSYNTDNEEISKIHREINETVMAHDWALQMHGFYLDPEEKEIRFDVVMSFDIRHDDGRDILYKEIKELYPDYDIIIVPDVDVSD